MNKDSKFIQYVFSGCQKAKNKQQVLFRDQADLKQAAVALIFWTPNTINQKLPSLGESHAKSVCSQGQLQELIKQENFECNLLFCQRQFNLRDIHSNEICFPGGKLENEESDFEAVIRETMEEVGMDLRRHQTFYLGRLPNNIEIKDGPKGIKVCAHIFLVSGEQPTITMNQSEMQDFRWVPLNHFYDLTDKLRMGKTTQSFVYFMIKSFFIKHPKIVDEIVKHFDHGLFCQIDIGMKNLLFGFSLIIFTQLLNIVLMQQQEGKEFFGDLRIICSAVYVMEVYFQDNTFVGKMANWYFSKMYKKYRIEKRINVRNHIGKL